MSALLLHVRPTEGDVYDPTGPQPDFRFEVVDGRIVRKPMGEQEMRWASIIHRLLAPAVEASGTGESYVDVGFSILRGKDRKPDVSVLSYARWPRGKRFPPGDFVPTAPDLAVEVVSPHDTARAVTAKRREYIRGGARLVWLVYPDEAEIQVFTSEGTTQVLTRDDTLTADPVVPGFALPLANLFPTTDPEAAP